VHNLLAPAHAIAQVEPRLDGGFGFMAEQWTLQPDAPSSRYVDAYGNLCRRFTLPSGRSTLRYDARVEVSGRPEEVDRAGVEVPPAQLPGDALSFMMPSRYCPSDEMADAACELFAGVDPGWTRVQAVCDWVHSELTFGYDMNRLMPTATEVFETRRGVCRDYAHLAITFCRALNIPARYAYGYIPEIGITPTGTEMDFCAWMEVYLSDRWWTFDPRNNIPRIGRVLVGRGRDAVDVAMLTIFGQAPLESLVVWADEVH
jgi:transglutaminase-like putative cysteine protease